MAGPSRVPSHVQRRANEKNGMNIEFEQGATISACPAGTDNDHAVLATFDDMQQWCGEDGTKQSAPFLLSGKIMVRPMLVRPEKK
jgi:hypothetical protein